MLLALLACVAPAPEDSGVSWSLPGTPPLVVPPSDPSLDTPAITTLPIEVVDGPIVIGAGPAGLAAAMDLEGAVVFEADSVVGGRARYAGAFMLMVGTEDQAERGVDDSVELATEDWPLLTGAEPTAATLAFLQASDGVHDRLEAIGVPLSITRPDPYVHRVRLHAPDGTGEALVEGMAANLPESVEVRLSTPVRGLVLVDGRVAGVRTDDGWIASSTVIIATGGFVNRAEYVSLYTGWSDGSWRLGEEAGAEGAALDFAAESGLGTVALDAIGSYSDLIGIPGNDGQAMEVQVGPVFPWIWVDADGNRFIDESATWSLTLSGLASAHENVWAISTWDAMSEAVSDENLPYLVEGPAWHCASDWETLAADIGVDATGLADSVSTSGLSIPSSTPDSLGRPPNSWPTLSGSPCAFRPGHIPAKNFGGLAVDDDGRVLDTGGAVIPGLWAVGEAAGMGVPGLGGAWGFDGSLSAVIWSGWRTAAAINAN